MRSFVVILLSFLIASPLAFSASKKKARHSSSQTAKTKKVKTSGMDPADCVEKYASTEPIAFFDFDGVEFTMMSNGQISSSNPRSNGSFLYSDGVFHISLSLSGTPSNLEIKGSDLFLLSGSSNPENIGSVRWAPLPR